MSEEEKKPKNKIRELRKEKGLSIDDLAKQIRVSRATINNYETGTHEPKLKNWQKLADYFGVDVPYLMGEATQDKSQEIIENMSGFLLDLEKDNLEDAQNKLPKLKNMIKHMTVSNFEQLGGIISSFYDSDRLGRLSDEALKIEVDFSEYLQEYVRDLIKMSNENISNRQINYFDDLWKLVTFGNNDAIIDAQNIEESDKNRILTFIRLALTFQNNLMNLDSEKKRDELSNEVIKKMEDIEEQNGLS